VGQSSVQRLGQFHNTIHHFGIHQLGASKHAEYNPLITGRFKTGWFQITSTETWELPKALTGAQLGHDVR